MPTTVFDPVISSGFDPKDPKSPGSPEEPSDPEEDDNLSTSQERSLTSAFSTSSPRSCTREATVSDCSVICIASVASSTETCATSCFSTVTGNYINIFSN